MSTHASHLHQPASPGGRAILVLGVLAVVSAALTALLSFTNTLDPPEWVRIVMTSGIPVGTIGVAVVWVLAPDSRREVATKVGLALVALSLVALIVMVNVAY